MKCENPITLKNGLTVGCGKCLPCQSAYRDEWSVRLQLHTYGYKYMPLFCCLTYRDSDQPYGDDGKPSLCRGDLALFIKRLKDRFDLYDTNFTYFGCGEYGDQFNRPHYHVLLFGFDELYHIWQKDIHKAENMLADVWQKGFADIGLAEWSGIHYVTKYVLKYDNSMYDGVTKPFTMASHGIGIPWLFTSDAVHAKSTFDIRAYRQRLYSMQLEIDWTDASTIARTADDICNYLRPYVPKLQCTLPSGKTAPVPRYLRARLYGSFEHFKGDPFWVFKAYEQLRDSAAYSAEFGQYDQDRELTAAQQKTLDKKQRIVEYLSKRLKSRKK